MDKILAIKNHECLCWKCLQKKSNIRTVEIPEMGYGSYFDGEGTIIQLCEECYQESNPEIWSMEEVQCEWDKENNYGLTEYKHEKEMVDYINGLPRETQQFVWNEYSYGFLSCKLDPQKWIDCNLA